MSRTAPRLATGGGLCDAIALPYWLDRPIAPPALEPLTGRTDADLLIVGGGFTGLWAALHAKEQDPDRDVLLLEARTCAHGASGRNGGFVEWSLTHGLDNGLERFPDEIDVLQRMAAENFDGLAADIERFGIDAAWHSVGHVGVAIRPYEVDELRASVPRLNDHGEEAVFLDRDEVRAELDSPRFLGGVWIKSGGATLDPAKLAWGLRRAALARGVRIHEHTAVTGLRTTATGVEATTAAASVDAARVLLASGAYPPLVRRMNRFVVPLHDYVLVTEPLTDEQRATIGWRRRQGFSGEGSRFTYYQLLEDGRMLWGGYQAVYAYGGGVDERRAADERVATLLLEQLLATFPQLEGIRVSHHWGGPIDMTSRFSMMFRAAHDGRSMSVAGYTGLGVAASRFGAQVGLDLLDGRATEATALRFVNSVPRTVPREPLRWPLVRATQRALARSEDRGGRRNAWLWLLDRLGAGVAA